MAGERIGDADGTGRCVADAGQARLERRRPVESGSADAVELRAVQVGVEPAARAAARRACPARRCARRRPRGCGRRRRSSRAGARSRARCGRASASASARWIASSDSESRCDVASSRITIAGSLSSTPRDREALLLAARHAVAALADDGVVAVGQRRDEVVDPRRLARGDELVVGGVGARRSAGSRGCVSWKRCGSCITKPTASRSESSVRSRTSWPSTLHRAVARVVRCAGRASRSWSCPRPTARRARPARPARP